MEITQRTLIFFCLWSVLILTLSFGYKGAYNIFVSRISNQTIPAAIVSSTINNNLYIIPTNSQNELQQARRVDKIVLTDRDLIRFPSSGPLRGIYLYLLENGLNAKSVFSTTAGEGFGGETNLEQFAPGSYAIITTSNQETCTGITLRTCRRSAAFMHEQQLTLIPSRATAVLVTEFDDPILNTLRLAASVDEVLKDAKTLTNNTDTETVIAVADKGAATDNLSIKSLGGIDAGTPTKANKTGSETSQDKSITTTENTTDGGVSVTDKKIDTDTIDIPDTEEQSDTIAEDERSTSDTNTGVLNNEIALETNVQEDEEVTIEAENDDEVKKEKEEKNNEKLSEDSNAPKEVAVKEEAAEVTDPEQLFDIRLLVKEPNVASLADLKTEVTFDSFGSVATPVSLFFYVTGADGKLVWQKSAFETITVETTRVYRGLFDDSDVILPEGTYSLHLRTSYAGGVIDTFTAPFTITQPREVSQSVIYSIILLLWLLIMSAFIGYRWYRAKNPS